MTERLPWVPLFAGKLLGALAQMPPDQQVVYQIVLWRSYEVWGPCPDSLEALAMRTKLNRRRVSDALDALFKAGKLERSGTGIINGFARGVMAEAQAFHEGRRRAGAAGAKARWEKGEQKQRTPHGKANAKAMANDAHLQREDSLFPEEGNRTRAEPAPDERTKLFRDGLQALSRITGRPVDKLRSLIGKWLRAANDDAVKVRRAIEDAEANRVAEPISWIERALSAREARGRTGNAFSQLRQELRERTREEEDDGTDAQGPHGRGVVPAGPAR